MIWAQPRDARLIRGVLAAHERAVAQSEGQAHSRAAPDKERGLSHPVRSHRRGDIQEEPVSHGHTCPFSQFGFRSSAIPGNPRLSWRTETSLSDVFQLTFFLFFTFLLGRMHRTNLLRAINCNRADFISAYAPVIKFAWIRICPAAQT